MTKKEFIALYAERANFETKVDAEKKLRKVKMELWTLGLLAELEEKNLKLKLLFQMVILK